MKKDRTKFDGTDEDRVYLQYFSAGDLHVLRHGRAVRAEGGTTHPSQLQLISDLFSRYCRPIVYPMRSEMGYSWRKVCILDESFSFLLEKSSSLKPDELTHDDLFYSALSAFFDAEGAICLRESSGKAYPVLVVSNRKQRIFASFQKGLSGRGFRTSLNPLKGKDGKVQWQLGINGKEALLLLQSLKLRHHEKVEARTLVLSEAGKPWSRVFRAYRAFREGIESSRDRCVKAAEAAYPRRLDRRRQKARQLSRLMANANSLRKSGHDIDFIGNALGRSNRTIYRWLQVDK